MLFFPGVGKDSSRPPCDDQPLSGRAPVILSLVETEPFPDGDFPPLSKDAKAYAIFLPTLFLQTPVTRGAPELPRVLRPEEIGVGCRVFFFGSP